MTEQEENDLREWMGENAKEYLLNAAKTLKDHCNNHDCETCIFYGQVYSVNKECKIAFKSPYGGVVPPEQWEVL